MTTPIKVLVSRKDLDIQEVPASARITNVRSLSSYNWIEAPKGQPTIAVPGSPALWSPCAGPRKLKKDTGWFYIAQNAARHPDYPLEPLFRALKITAPDFDLHEIDVVTDRNNLRKLLGFINPRASNKGREEFTIRVEVIKETTVFCREEPKMKEFIPIHKFAGYGHEFEKVYTKEQIRGSTGHYRIIRYELGGLKFVLRYETDGYVGDRATQSTPSPPNTGANTTDLANALNELSIAANTATAPALVASPISNLRVQRAGDAVPISAILEVKTRVSHRSVSVNEVAPQLFFSQTTNLVRAYHLNGTFQDPDVEDVANDVNQWALKHEEDLKRLILLIKKIVERVKELGGRAILRYDPTREALDITGAEKKVDLKQLLPDDVYEMWNQPYVDAEE
jgi:hypothetical protein